MPASSPARRYRVEHQLEAGLSFTSWRSGAGWAALALLAAAVAVHLRPLPSGVLAALLAVRHCAALAARIGAVRTGSSWTNAPDRSASDGTARR
jgi:hypothetical protein